MEDAWNTAKGWFGYRPEQKVGKDLGRYLGQLGSEYFPIPGVNGSQFGEWVGSFLPFKQGGFIHPVSNIREQMLSEGFQGFAEGGQVPKNWGFEVLKSLRVENGKLKSGWDDAMPQMFPNASKWLGYMEGGVVRTKEKPAAGIVRYPKGYIKLKTKMPKEGKKWAKKIKKLRQQDQVG